MKKTAILLNFIFIFLLGLGFYVLGLRTPALAYASQDYYVFDAKPYVFSRWCYSIGQCQFANPPPGKTFTQLNYDFDLLSFLVSLQGIVNRNERKFLLLGSDVDENWLVNLGQIGLFPSNLQRRNLTNIDEVINNFKNNPQIKGSVVWEAEKPFTLDLAFSLAGAENLVVVRKNSEIYNKIVAVFPVKINLTNRFTTKREGYVWLVDNYLKTGKLAPILVNLQDGWPVYRHTFLHKMFVSNEEVEGWNLLSRDLGISKKVLFFDLGIHPGMKDPIENQTGIDHETVKYLLNAVRQLSGNKIFEVWGWPEAKYNFDCNDNGSFDSADGVICGEWYWIEMISGYGGVERIGGGEFYGKEPANMSFYQHGTLTADLIFQPSPLSPKQLLKKKYTDGYPRNFSFEENLSAEPWIVETTNKSVYRDPQNSSHGSQFLQVNVNESDKGKSLYQDVPINLLKGYHYAFEIKLRSPSGQNVEGRQVVWTIRNNKGIVMCENKFKKNNQTYENLVCEFDVKEEGLNQVRLQVYIDTPGVNYSFDEAYFSGPNTLIPNTSKPNQKFLLLYQGDDDVVTAPYVIRTGVYPYTWHQQASISTAWGLTTHLSVVLPSIWDYFVQTKSPKQTFVMPNSGLGYLNVTKIPDQYLGEWIKETALYQRQFQIRSGWDLEGVNWEQVPSSTKVARVFKVIAPEGIFYGAPPEWQQIIHDGLPIVPMTDFSWAGDNIEERANKLNEITRQMDGYGSKFLVLRNVFVSDKHLEDIINRAIQLGGDFEIVDPVTFFYLFRLKKGGPLPLHRLSVISHNLPNTMAPNREYQITLKIRNDGWAIWIPKSSYDCDGSGTVGSGCYALAWGAQLKQNFSPTGLGMIVNFPYNYRANLPKKVFPGEEVELNFSIRSPSQKGDYVFQFDGVKEGWEFFETNGNVPWLKIIKVGFTNSDVINLLSKYLTANIQADLNGDGVVNGMDFGKSVWMSQ